MAETIIMIPLPLVTQTGIIILFTRMKNVGYMEDIPGENAYIIHEEKIITMLPQLELHVVQGTVPLKAEVMVPEKIIISIL